MKRVLPYLRLMRLDKPIGIWLVWFPAAWGVLLSPAPVAWWLLILLLLGAVLIRGAGCIVNDLTDRKLDAKVARTKTRPLASGVVSKSDALLLLAVLLLDGLILCLALPPKVIVFALIVLPLIVAYPWMKRFTFWPQAFLGLTFNFGALIGWASSGAALSTPAWLLFAACFFWTLGYDTLYAVEDMKGDKKAGIKSTALRIGTGSRLGWFIAVCYLMMLLLLCAAIHEAGHGGNAVGLALLGVAIHAGWQAGQSARLAAGSKHAGALFRSNQWLGGLLLLGLAAQRAWPYLA